jgi:hypothetical protein
LVSLFDDASISSTSPDIANDEWQYLAAPDGQRIGINTSVFEDKYTAVSMLALYIGGMSQF